MSGHSADCHLKQTVLRWLRTNKDPPMVAFSKWHQISTIAKDFCPALILININILVQHLSILLYSWKWSQQAFGWHPNLIKWGWFETLVVSGCVSLVMDTSFSSLFRGTPTLLWMTPYLGLDMPTGMEFLCIIGITLSAILLVSQRCRDCLGYLMLWFLYYSMLPVSFVESWFWLL